jgi:SecD/SecF fusion protein
MRNIYRNAAIVIAALIVFTWAIIPPAEKLKLGKDLRGGVSLVYSVAVREDENAAQVLSDTINVLKDRVDPRGVMEISMVAQGRDRIEVTMPQARPEVKEFKQRLEDKLEQLGAFNLSANRLGQIVSMPPADRQAEIGKVKGLDPARRTKLDAVIVAWDESQAARTELELLKSNQAEPAQLDPVVQRAADAELRYEKLSGELLESVISPAEVRRALSLSTLEKRLQDAATKQVISIPSQQSVAIDELKRQHPSRLAEIEDVISSFGEYSKKRTTLDDPQDLKRLLRAAGVLSFRITVGVGRHPEEARLRESVRERGPNAAAAPDARWFRINQINSWFESIDQFNQLRDNPAAFWAGRGLVGERYLGEHYVLCWDTRTARLTQAEGQWSVARAFPQRDDLGRPAIGFEMNPKGGLLLGDLTKEHVREPMAVLLDDEIYTAPTLQSAISKRGQITGDFSEAEISYIVKVLAAGSLQAKLSPEPISESTVGPQLGLDNLQRGFAAGLAALALIAVFMVVYYFGVGFVAVIVLIINSVIILGAMSLNKAAFTMPGIAGLVLTLGVAIDANVLIYERMREEFNRGIDFKNAVRLGFDKAMSSIVDGNITNLIVCVVLAYTGTQEIKGFAITMSIGVLSTLFCLIVSRLFFDLMILAGVKRVSMLPMAVPALQTLLTPRINWLRLRYVFIALSVTYCTIGLVMAFTRGEQMLSTEFRGGTEITLQLKPASGPGSERLTMQRPAVEERVHAIGEKADIRSPLRMLAAAEVLPQNPRLDGVTSDEFKIRTVATEVDLIKAAVLGEFKDVLETQPALAFTHFEEPDGRKLKNLAVFPIISDDLGEDISRRLPAPQSVKDFRGGVAIVLDKLSPEPTLDQLRERLQRIRSQADFSDTLTRTTEVFVIDGTDGAVKSAAVVVADPTVNYFENQDRWLELLGNREWRIAVEGLSVASTPASVQSFSAAIADTFRAQAIVACVLSFVLIALYIWIRFKSFRYSFAALVALVHDVLTVIGAVALCAILYDAGGTTQSVVSRLGILPFKIDLNMIAAILTVAGYSLNDTIIIMDRIRENRGKSLQASGAMINAAINQTISRTLITSGTTLMSAIMLYIFGGEGVRAFSFALLVGVAVGTYSSIAVAAPIVWVKGRDTDGLDNQEDDKLPAPASI